MAFLTLPNSCCSTSSSSSSRPCLLKPSSSSSSHLRRSSLSIPIRNPIHISITIDCNRYFTPCSAAKQQSASSVKKRRTTPPNKKRAPSKPVVEVIPDDDDDDDDDDSTYSEPASLPKPPAGFVLDTDGKVLMVSSKRMVTIVDSSNNLPLDCIIRRVFTSSRGHECLLLCPVDTPVQVLKSSDVDGWTAVSDDEVEGILPGTAYALAKIHMHLVHSGFCYTARGGFCYSEEDIFDFATDDDQDVDGSPTEGVQITSFFQDGAHYMIYTPSDPLMFVAVKDADGLLRIADDDLLEDPAVVDAVDEETEFNALVEEEATLLESLLGDE